MLQRYLSLVEQQLNELIGIKQNPDVAVAANYLKPLKNVRAQTVRETVLKGFLRHIAEKGFVPISNGGFGAVFSHPKLSYVLKVYRDDPAYSHFVDFCAKHAGNSSLPVFRGRPIRIEADTFCVRMERLTRVTSPATIDAVDLLADFAASRRTPADFRRDHEDTENDQDHRAEEMILAQSGLLETMYAVARARGKMELDLHDGNFMMRGKTIVITDPYYVPQD